MQQTSGKWLIGPDTHVVVEDSTIIIVAVESDESRTVDTRTSWEKTVCPSHSISTYSPSTLTAGIAKEPSLGKVRSKLSLDAITLQVCPTHIEISIDQWENSDCNPLADLPNGQPNNGHLAHQD